MIEKAQQPRRHRVFRYGYTWYGDCGLCDMVFLNRRWSAALELLTFHIQDHQPLTMDRVSS